MAAFDWQGTLKRLGLQEEAHEMIADAMFRSADWMEMDRGVLTTEEVIQRFCSKIPQYEQEIRQVIEAYDGMIRQYPYTKELIRTLKEKGYGVYYLSNYGEYGYQKTKDQLDFIELMDGGLFSYEVQMVKPNRWIYEELLLRYGLRAEDCIFFDDNKENVEAANKLGMIGIQFLGYEDAVEHLKELGVL